VITATLTLRVHDPSGIHAAQLEQLSGKGDIDLTGGAGTSYSGGKSTSRPHLERRAIDGQLAGDEEGAIRGAERADYGSLP
jgi:hypothetical protein